MLATLMQALDTTIANVALPNMQGSLSATQDQISWVLTSYIVAAAIATPATVDAVAGAAHDRDDLLDRGRIGEIALPLVARRAAGVKLRPCDG